MDLINLDAYKEEVMDKFNVLDDRYNQLSAHVQSLEDQLGNMNNIPSGLVSKRA